MTLPISGEIKISEVRDEFGGTDPSSLSEYYGVDTGVPASGQISMSDFYGASSFTAPLGNIITSTPNKILQIYVASVAGTASININWGDGTNEDKDITSGEMINHSYVAAGVYQLTVKGAEKLGVLELGSTEIQIDGALLPNVADQKYHLSSDPAYPSTGTVNLRDKMVNLEFNESNSSDVSAVGDMVINTADIPLGMRTLKCNTHACKIVGDIADIQATWFTQLSDPFVSEMTGNISKFDGSPMGWLNVGGSNTISGTIDNLSSQMRSFIVTGNNTLTGNISAFAANVLDIVIGGNSSISGALSSISAATSLKRFEVYGTNTITGTPAEIPKISQLKIFILDGLNTVTGDVGGIQTDYLDNISIKGHNTISGGFNDLGGMTGKSIEFGGYNTISGWLTNLAGSKGNPKSIILDGNNTITGDISGVGNSIETLIVRGHSTVDASSLSDFPMAGSTTPKKTIIVTPLSGGLPTEAIDRILANSREKYYLWNDPKVITLDGANKGRSVASQPSVDNLEANGFTLTLNDIAVPETPEGYFVAVLDGGGTIRVEMRGMEGSAGFNADIDWGDGETETVTILPDSMKDIYHTYSAESTGFFGFTGNFPEPLNYLRTTMVPVVVKTGETLPSEYHSYQFFGSSPPMCVGGMDELWSGTKGFNGSFVNGIVTGDGVGFNVDLDNSPSAMTFFPWSLYGCSATGDIANFSGTSLSCLTEKCTLFGKIEDLNAATYNIEVGGQNTISGDIGLAITKMTNLREIEVEGNNTITGSISGISTLASLKYFIIGGNNTVSGSFFGCTTKLHNFDVRGNNTISGSFTGQSDIPSPWLRVEGNNTLTGDISNIVALLAAGGYSYFNQFIILGNNTISGDLAGFNWAALAAFDVKGNNTIDAFTGLDNNLALPAEMTSLSLNPVSGGLSSAEVDALATSAAKTAWKEVSVMAAQGAKFSNPVSNSMVFELGGANGAYTADSNLRRQILAGKGVTVLP